MLETRNKYSLWLVPKGDVELKLSSLISTLSNEYKGPVFAPHITLVGNVRAEEIEPVIHSVTLLADQLDSFNIELGAYDYLDEEFRCLFLLAHSEELNRAYEIAASLFPQVQDEHFQKLPHMSVLYGSHSEQTKLEIIKEYPIDTMEFPIDSICVYSTGGSIDNWHHEATIAII